MTWAAVPWVAAAVLAIAVTIFVALWRREAARRRSAQLAAQVARGAAAVERDARVRAEAAAGRARRESRRVHDAYHRDKDQITRLMDQLRALGVKDLDELASELADTFAPPGDG
ncbi:MAG: hypothetical protein ACPGQD_01270 [Planctomycetota bacterium]